MAASTSPRAHHLWTALALVACGAVFFPLGSLAATKSKPSLADQIAASTARARAKCPEAFTPGTVLQSAFWDLAFHYDQVKPGWRKQGDWPERLVDEVMRDNTLHADWHEARKQADVAREMARMKAEEDKILPKHHYPSAAEVDAEVARMNLEARNMPGSGSVEERERRYQHDEEIRRRLRDHPLRTPSPADFQIPRVPTIPGIPGLVDGPAFPPAPNPEPAPATTGTAPPDSGGIELVREGGLCKVPVQVNGALTLKFEVDSGASQVCIPRDVFTTLLRAETIQERDFLPPAMLTFADGSRAQAIRVLLRSVKVGDFTLENVEAVVTDARGPLLLGQSFLSKFKEWRVDNENNRLFLRQ